MKSIHKKLTKAFLFVILPLGSFAQSYPLSSNVWSNPDFVERFMGSYGVKSEIEPKITEAESNLFGELITLMQNDQMAGAITKLRNYINQNAQAENPPSPAMPFTLANMLLQEGQLDLAIENYKKAIKQFPNFLRAYKNLGLAYVQRGNFEDATKVITKSIELGERGGDTFGLLGYCYLNLGSTGPALEAYRQATLLNPENKEWFVGKAEALMRTENFREAIKMFEHLIFVDKEKTAYFTSMANAYIALNEPLEAAKILEIVFRNGNADASVLSLLGDIYLNAAMPSLALRPYLNVFEVNSKLNSSRIKRTANAFIQRGYYEEAGKYLDRADAYFQTVEIDDEVISDFLNLRAELALGQGENENAAKILEKVIEMEPSNGHALLLLGNYNFSIGNFEEADYYFDRASGIESSALDALIQSARLHVQMRDYPTAIRKLRDAQAIDYQDNVQNFLEAIQGLYERIR